MIEDEIYLEFDNKNMLKSFYLKDIDSPEIAYDPFRDACRHKLIKVNQVPRIASRFLDTYQYGFSTISRGYVIRFNYNLVIESYLDETLEVANVFASSASDHVLNGYEFDGKEVAIIYQFMKENDFKAINAMDLYKYFKIHHPLQVEKLLLRFMTSIRSLRSIIHTFHNARLSAIVPYLSKITIKEINIMKGSTLTYYGSTLKVDAKLVVENLAHFHKNEVILSSI